MFWVGNDAHRDAPRFSEGVHGMWAVSGKWFNCTTLDGIVFDGSTAISIDCCATGRSCSAAPIEFNHPKSRNPDPNRLRSFSWIRRLRQRRGEQDEDDADKNERKRLHESSDNYGHRRRALDKNKYNYIYTYREV